MNNKPFTNIELQRIVRLRLAGWHPKEIAAQTGRTQPSINRALSIEKNKNGYDYPKIQRWNLKWTHERIEEKLVKPYSYPTKCYYHIAQENNLTPPRVSYLLAKRAHALQQGIWRI